MSVLFLSGPALGHIVRLVAVAREVRKMSSTIITFALPACSKYIDLIVKEGYNIRSIEWKNDESYPLYVFPGRVESVIDEIKPKVIIVDWNMLQWASTIIWPKIPRILVTNIFLTNAFPHIQTVQDVKFSKLNLIINGVREARGLPALNCAGDLYDADHVCLADPDCITRMYSEIPSHHLKVGAVFLDLHTGLDRNINHFNNMLLISVGSTGQVNITDDMILHLKCVAKCDSVVMVGRNFTNLKTLDYSAPFAHMERLLRKSKIVLTHGGAGSTYQALSQGKPVVVYPGHINQRILGLCLERAGVGVCVSESDIYSKIQGFDFENGRVKSADIAKSMHLEDGPGQISKLVLLICKL